MVDELFNPGLRISIESMSIHPITNKIFADKPVFKISSSPVKTDFVPLSNVRV